MDKILITGASGFLGMHVLNYLHSKYSSNYEIHILGRKEISREQVHFHNVDILDRNKVCNIVNKIKAKYLLHLAWDVTPASYLTSSNNMDYLAASISLIKDFVESGGYRVLTAGTCYEYDISQRILNEETSEFKPHTLYGNCKKSLFDAVSFFTKQRGVSYTSAKYFYMYGEGEHPDRLVPYIIRNLLYGKSVTCNNPKAVRDYIYIKDAAEATVNLLFSNINGNVNISTGEGIKIEDIFMRIAKLLNKEESVIYSYDISDSDIIIGENSILKYDVGFNRYTGIEDGIKSLINSYRY